MRARRLPIIVMAVGIVTKTVLIVFTKFGNFPTVLDLAARYDPDAFKFAQWGATLFFSPKRIAPGNGELQIAESLLVIGFGVECFFFGYVIRWIANLRRPDRP